MSHTCPHTGKGGVQVDDYLSWMQDFVEYDLAIESMEAFDKPLNVPFGIYGDHMGTGIWSYA